MRKSKIIWLQWVLWPLFLVMSFSHSYGAPTSGYSEYYIPGDEDSMMFILDTIGANDQTTAGMHSEIVVTAWSANTTIYYDHWEDGYDFDPDDPLTADETYPLAIKGDTHTFTGNNIPLPRNAVADCGTSTCYYDGRDYIYIAGGFTTVSRASWTEMAGTLLAVAWELYPVRPQLIKYILPIGEDLAGNPLPNLQDFERVFALVQSTEDNTIVTVDFDGDGTPDNIDIDGDSVCDGVTSVTLNRGDVLRLGSDADCISSLHTGTVIQGTETLQVQYIIGDEGSNYEIRGFSAFPRGFWDDEYYAPVDSANATDDPTDIYIHNPHTTDLTIQYQSGTISGSFTIPPRNPSNGDYGTVSFQAMTGSYAPQSSALYLKGSDEFWGISTIDITANAHDWGYSLVPASFLKQEHLLGWAPGSFPVGTGDDADNSGIFITPATDNTRIFIDQDNDGTADQTYDVDRLESLYIFDSTDGDMSNAAIWATGPFTSAYGQNPDTATPYAPAIDVGYTIIPGVDFIDLVLTVDKTADPVVVPTAAGQQSTFTLVIGSHEYGVDDVNVTDFLPAGWQYVDDSTTITLADKTQISGNPADPVTNGKIYRERFNAPVYNSNADNDAPAVWTTNWIEESDDGTATGGEIQILTDTGVTPNANALLLTDNDSAIARIADLSGVSGAVLSFDYRADSIESANEYVEVQVCQDAAAGTPITCSDAGGWTTVVQLGGGAFDQLDSDWGGGNHVPLSTVSSNWTATAGLSWCVQQGTTPSSGFNPGPSGGNPDPYIYHEASSADSGDVCQNGFALGDTTEIQSNIVDAGAYALTFDFDYNFTLNGSTDTCVHVDVWNGSSWDLSVSDAGSGMTDSNDGNSPAVFCGDNNDTWDNASIDLDALGYNSGNIRVRLRQVTGSAGTVWHYDYAYDNLHISGPARSSEYLHYEADLADLLASPNSGTFAVRFTETGVSSSLEVDDYIYVDNVEVRAGQDNQLVWPDSLLVDMAPNQQIIITFIAETTTDFSVGDISRNDVEAVGSRSISGPTGTVTQTFTATDFAFVGYGEMQVEKTTGGIDPLYPGNQYTYTVTVTNPVGATDSITGIAIYDPISDGVSYVADSSQIAAPTSNVADLFNIQAYNNNDGSANWATNWIEESDDGTATGGEIQILTDTGVTPNASALRLIDNDSAIARIADLSGGSEAVLSFDYRADSIENPNEVVEVQVCQDAAAGTPITCSDAGGWTTVVQFGGANYSEYQYYETDLGAFLASPNSATFGVRFTEINSETGSGLSAGDTIYVDNVDVRFDLASTGPAGDPPNFVSAGDNYSLAPGQTLTLTFDVTVDDPLASGIDEIVNTACVTTSEIFSPVCDDASNIIINPTTDSASVGDRVWFDTDGDGMQDIGEAGLANVEVTLRDEFGTIIAETTTNSIGYYLFSDVEPGNGYYVEITYGLPSGLQQSAPGGHSDNRTDAFDLIAGQAYMDADLGYAAPSDSATIGDLVWSDADEDGVRDLGEPGLAGITVELYLDDGDSIFEPGTDDALVASTSTTAGGSYLFTGITASGTEDYTVHVDPTQSALSGFTPTTSTQLFNVDVDAGDVLLNNDFGFQNTTTTYTIKDRVWFDSNEDEEDDGENGIAGVVVELLDASLNVIASTITYADGYFTFSGVSGGGADYTVRISDTDGVLDDYFGTTAEALAGEMAIDNLNSYLDFTVEPDEPNFGYSISASIGNTVFNDLNGIDGQDTGEPGIGNVMVDLYLDDGDGEFDSALDTLIATRRTDTNGKYLFSGLDDGTYFVHIDDTQSVLVGYTLTTVDDDDDNPPTDNGHQREVTITGSSSYVEADYGYRVTTNPRAVSGTVWDDIDEDGVIDGTEAFFENVTMELLTGGAVVAVTSTDANGDYSFSGLPAGFYTVRITDDNSVLSGYNSTYERSEGITAPFNFQEDVDLSSNDQTGINFGYMKPTPTLAVISSFSAYEDSGKVVVQWETASEIGTAGFYLYRKDGSTYEYSRINKKLLVGLLHSPQGGTYRYTDRTAFPGDTYTYKLQEIEFNGTTRDYGPFTVNTASFGPDDTPEPVDSEYTKKAKKSSSGRKGRTRLQKSYMPSSAPYKSAKKAGVKAKIAVSEDGLYYLDASDISDTLGTKRHTIVKAIKSNRLVITNRGNDVALLPSEGNNGIYFFGEGTDSIFTDRNIYLLEKGRKKQGTRMETVEGTGPAPSSSDETFSEEVHTEEDHWPLTDIFDDPEVDYWLWDYIIAVDPDAISEDDEKYSLSFTIHTDGAAHIPDNAYLTVHLKGYTDTTANPDHHVSVTLNNEELTTLNGKEVKRDWNGTDEPPLTFDFKQELLNEVENTVTVTGLLKDGVDYSIFYVDSFDLTYQRHYHAVNNRLIIRGDGNPVVTVDGFTGDEILVFDVSEANMPKLINATTIDESSGSYRVSFAPVSPDTEYLVVSSDAVISGLDIRADTASQLKNENNAADYVLITSPELWKAAETLLDYRQGQGYSTMLVDVEDIMDEFSFGISHPGAIKDFLSYAYHKWKTPPMYVLLAGAGNYDYRDNNGYGGNIIPPIMVSTPDGLFASDNRFADVAGNDGVPEMAIGRLPVLTPEELLTYKEKVETYEMPSGEPWEKRIIMLADDPDDGGNFDLDSNVVADIIPASYTAEKIYLTKYNFSTARQSLHDALNNGVAFLNYIGHGGLDRIGLDHFTYKGVMQTDDVGSLNNGGKLPVISAMTCVVGQFAIAGYDSLGESLVIQGNGGAVAIWAPTGLSFNDLAIIMNEEYFRAVFEDKETVLGDALLKTLQVYGSRSDYKFMLDIFNLLGDPALRLK